MINPLRLGMKRYITCSASHKPSIHELATKITKRHNKQHPNNMVTVEEITKHYEKCHKKKDDKNSYKKKENKKEEYNW